MARKPEGEKPAVYKPSEVAKMLRCDARTLYAMIDRGELRAIKLGRVIRIPADEVDALLAQKPPASEG